MCVRAGVCVQDHLKECEGPDAVCSKLHGVQHGDLHEAVRLCASARPVLITLILHTV